MACERRPLCIQLVLLSISIASQEGLNIERRPERHLGRTKKVQATVGSFLTEDVRSTQASECWVPKQGPRALQPA